MVCWLTIEYWAVGVFLNANNEMSKQKNAVWAVDIKAIIAVDLIGNGKT